MRTISVAVLVAPILVSIVSARAAEGGADALIAEGKDLVGRAALMSAAERFGDAAAAAHAIGDLQAEERVATAFEGLLATVASKPLLSSRGDATDAPWLGSVLAATMRKLDADRNAAYVSAPVLAREVLMLSTEAGQFLCVPEAARVALRHKLKPLTSGRAATVVAKYAEGMKAVAEKRYAYSAPLLDAAAAEAARAGWRDLAVHAGTEAAAAWDRAGDVGKATASVTAVAELLADAGHNPVLEWNLYARVRLAGAPPSVRRPLEDLVAKHMGPHGGTSEGGRGGKGGLAGVEPVSDVGRLLETLAPGRPFVSVTRTARGMQFHWATTPDEPPVLAFGPKVGIASEGGVVLAVHGRSVALLMVDLEGRRSVPGGGSHPPSGRAFYLLAEGETYEVAKDGVVTVAKAGAVTFGR